MVVPTNAVTEFKEARHEGTTRRYLVHWLDNDHVTLVYPGPEARVEPPRAKSRT
jgi:hypothetical protein